MAWIGRGYAQLLFQEGNVALRYRRAGDEVHHALNGIGRQRLCRRQSTREVVPQHRLGERANRRVFLGSKTCVRGYKVGDPRPPWLSQQAGVTREMHQRHQQRMEMRLVRDQIEKLGIYFHCFGNPSRMTVFDSRKGSRPSTPPSRPTPDCLKPPNAMPKSLRNML